MEKEETKKSFKKKAGKVLMYVLGYGVLFIIIAYALCSGLQSKSEKRSSSDDDYVEEWDLGCDLKFVNYGEDKSTNYIKDNWSNKVILDNLSWISCGTDETDSLVAFAQKNRRGYFNKRQRKTVLLDEKFIKVYMYKEGRALAESLDSLYILDTKQKEIAQFAKTGERITEVNCYHNGYLPMLGDNGKLGLIDTCGVWALEPQYDKISYALEEFWLGISDPVMVDKKTGKQADPHRIMMDSNLRVILEGAWTYLMVTKDGYVTVGDKNHWQWHYDLQGNIIDDFVCKDIQQMTYTTGEKKWITGDDGMHEYSQTQQVDVEETATLLCYTTSDDWQGLMTREGKIITPPVFWSIRAISKNVYLCNYDTSNEHGILVNEKGEKIKTRETVIK